MQIIQESTFNTYNPKDVIKIEADTVFYNASKNANDRIKIVNSSTGRKTVYNRGFLSFWTEITQIETRDLGFLCANRDYLHGDNIEAYDLVGGHVVGKQPTDDKMHN